MKKQEKWFHVLVPTTRTTQEAITYFLFELGTTGVIEEPDLLHAYFAATRQTSEFLQEIQKYLCSLQELGFVTHPEKVCIETIPNQDWNSEWKKNYRGFALSERIFVKPTWEALPAGNYECLIEIDPEMAFGTGTHETTQLCIKLLEILLSGGERVLDIGTGTGILAIAAAKLGAREVIAFDIDPIATSTADKNSRRNGVRQKVSFYTGLLAVLKVDAFSFDVVLANVNRMEIVKMLPLLKKMLHYHTKLIISGILVEEEDILRFALAENDFSIVQTISSEEWIACYVQKRNPDGNKS